ncbi:hypothetical protein [Alicyclobacillus sp. SO9]|uniref:TerC family protein n=1 Tax=Alicyclobacillus sp. SO9 TaxID=2665646 RepID=UPI0018E72C91|nr:hypothetical protein [Alicyclobacillus sp. SO9]QQE78151.1 hypothetical protein GI364_20045 [Alicyclobacillus sp. SO9]
MISAFWKVAVTNLLLSSDNALMIAVLTNAAKKKHRLRALMWSYLLSDIAQLILLFAISYLFRIKILQSLFGLFICFMALQLLNNQEGDKVEHATKHQTLLPVIGKITTGNLMMSFENAAALVGVSHGHVWTAWAGVVVTSAFVFFGSHLLSSFLDRFDFILYLGSVVLFWIGAKLVFTEPVLSAYAKTGIWLTTTLYFLVVAYIYARRKGIFGRTHQKG